MCQSLIKIIKYSVKMIDDFIKHCYNYAISIL